MQSTEPTLDTERKDETPEDHSISDKPAVQSLKKKKNLFSLLTLAIVAVIVVAMSMHVYAKPTDAWTRKIVSVLPYPALIVDGTWVPMKDFLAERDALVNYFTITGATEMLPTDADLDTQIVDTLINKTIIAQIAREQKITLSQEQADVFYQDVLAQSGGEEAFAQQLSETFGWTVEEFKERVVNTVVLATQVSEWVAADATLQADAKAQADQAFARLEGGEDFATVAGELSQDFSAAQGGDIGFVSDSELPPEWAETVRSLEVGNYTPVIETTESFLIFQLTDRITAGEDTQLQLSVIVIPKRTLDDLVAERTAEAKVKRFVGKVE